jgi:formylmethanofuran dehydrogenase subunit E
MNAKQIMEQDDFKRCADFHGHICPGLSIGYRAAKAGLSWLREHRAPDEELVAVVETDACSADAVQVLTGCTFGKGNFIWKDYGKMALTLLSRRSGQGVRVAIRPGAFSPGDEHAALLQKVMAGNATEDERNRFQTLHWQRSLDVLEAPVDRLFVFTPTKTVLPSKARIEPSQPCARCGEPTMASKLLDFETEKICRGCLESFW